MAFKAHFLNVGLADCTIFQMNNDLVLIDCGFRRIGDNIYKPVDIVKYIRDTLGKSYIDLLIVTHPHHDHYLGMQDIINSNMTVAKFWGSPYNRRNGDNSLDISDWNEYVSLKNKLVPDGKKRFICYNGSTITFSDCTFTILGPRESVNDIDTRECHDASLVIQVSTPNNNIIVCGDASDSELELVLQDHDLSACQLLRASHHGSINGAYLEFIKAAEPIHTIISTASGIIDNLPDKTALQRYASNTSSKVYRTDNDGTITSVLKSI